MDTRAVDRQGDSSVADLPLADKLLLDQFTREGNQAAFAAIMERHGSYILGVCQRGPVFEIGQRTSQGQKRTNKFSQTDSAANETGFARLRIVRQGSRVSFFAAEGEAGNWQYLHTAEVSADDLQVVRFAADPVLRPDVAMDVRLIDFNGQLFRYEGPNARHFIKPDAKGLRWQFESGHAPTRPVGIYWKTPLRGDFIVTAQYEILKATAWVSSFT